MTELSNSDANSGEYQKEKSVVASNVNASEVIDVRLLFSAIWKWKIPLVIAILLGTASGLRDVHGFQPESTASILIQPYSSGGGMSQRLAALSQIASSVGISVGSGRGGGGTSGDVAFNRVRILLARGGWPSCCKKNMVSSR